MNIKVRNKIITEPITVILRQAQRELKNGKLKDIDDTRKSNILITCPCHKDGKESRPSCRLLNDDVPDLEMGFAHCFACGYSAPFVQVIADLFDEDSHWAEDWLLERYGDTYLEQEILLPKIELTPQRAQKQYLDESVLLQYDYYHPYMWKRRLTKEVADQFRVGYDKIRNAITFPVYDEKHKLVMVTARSVDTKRFWIPEGVEKPVYLLYDLLERHQDTAYVAESQINALTLRSYGLNGIALFGTGSATQLETLKRSGIRNFVLLFDGDEAGRKGALRFIRNMSKDVFITDIRMPAGKDVNDLEYKELKTLLSYNGIYI